MITRCYSAFPELDPRSRRFPPPPPLDAVARLCRLGVRLRDDGRFLVARVPPEVAETEDWPALDRLLARHAPWLADAAALIEVVRRRRRPEEVADALRRLSPGLTELAVDLVGGRAELDRLLAAPLEGATLDLACFIYAEVRQVELVLSQPDAGPA